MAVPTFQDLMVPVLRVLARGDSWAVAQLRDAVAKEVGLPQEDRDEKIRSGSGRFDNRVDWSLTHMHKARLVQRPARGVVQLTERGRDTLTRHPARVDMKVLAEFEEYREFQNRSSSRNGTQARSQPNVTETPRERISDAVAEANDSVADELLQRVLAASPDFLERLVLRLLTAMGYGGRAGAAEHLGRTGDGGLDGVIREDPLGLNQIYVQAKRYADRSVGRPEVQAFVGALHGHHADRGIFIATSRFTNDAESYVRSVQDRIVLIDGPQLARLMVAHDIGTQVQETHVIKRVDEDFFDGM